MRNFPLTPDAASEYAPQMDLLFWGLVALSFGLLAMVFLPMAWWVYKYRRNHDTDRTPPELTTWKIEVTWTLLTTGIFCTIFVFGALLYVRQKTPPADALEINVIGKQWMWYAQHPEGHREIDSLHVPVGRTVKLMMTSQDVIHSFFIPAFRIKQDVVPGRYTTEWFKATRAGVYHLFCSEYCGTEHSHMIGEVDVMTPTDYERWLNSGGIAQESLVAAGQRLYSQLGCSGCHGENARIRAPSLVGLYGKPVPLSTGELVNADDLYLHDSIVQPLKQIVAGYEPVMPTYQGQIAEAEVFQLVQYIKSLRNESPAEYLRQNRTLPGHEQNPATDIQAGEPLTTPPPR